MFFAFLSSVVFFGTVVVIKTAYAAYPFLTSLDMTLPRCIILPILSSLVALVMQKNIFAVPRGSRLVLFTRLFFGTTGMISYFTALELLPTNKAVVLFNLTPIFTGILAALVLKEKMHWSEYIGVFVAFGGVVLVSLTAEGGSTETHTLGVVLVILTTLCAAIAYVLQRKVLQSIHFMAIPFYFGLSNGVVILSIFVTWQW